MYTRALQDDGYTLTGDKGMGKVLRRYRRFRKNKRYDHPLLIFLADTAIVITKNAIPIALLASTYFIAQKFVTRHHQLLMPPLWHHQR